MNPQANTTPIRQGDTIDLVDYLEQGRRMRSAALWNFATHLKPSVEARDAQPEAAPPIPFCASSDTARYMQEGRSMRNAVMIELLAGAWTMLAKGVRHIVRRSRSTSAFS